MNVYATENIRNVVLLGHGGCGKTSLIESMAFTTGIIKRVRTVAEGGTVSDYDKEEIKRKFSIQSSVIPLEVDNVKVNLLDTPGLFDFSGEVYEALSVADAAVIVINGKSGVEVGTEVLISAPRRAFRLSYILPAWRMSMWMLPPSWTS